MWRKSLLAIIFIVGCQSAVRSEPVRFEIDVMSVIEEVFQTALSRRPTDQERSAAHSHFENVNDRFVAIQDLAWALMNAKEFNFRR